MTVTVKRSSWTLTLTALAAGLAIGGAIMFALVDANDVRVVRGTVVDVSADGDAIDLDIEDGEFGLTPLWREPGTATWRTSDQPSCLAPLSSGATVEVGVIDVSAGNDAPSTTAIVWVKCETEPS